MAEAGSFRGRPSMEECCWVCLATEGESGEPLTMPCQCPRMCHLKCLARWQLQSAGKEEEGRCRFCRTLLPSWQTTLVPADVKPVTPVMAIKFEGKTYKLKVKPGADGLAEFQNQVRQLLGFDITDDFDVTFECSVNGEKMKLSGLNSYGAATQCAAITAAQRETKPRRGLRSGSRRHAIPSGISQSASGERTETTSGALPHESAANGRSISPYRPLEHQRLTAAALAFGGGLLGAEPGRSSSPYRPLGRSATAGPTTGGSRNSISLCGETTAMQCDSDYALTHSSSSGLVPLPMQSAASISQFQAAAHASGIAASRLAHSASTDSLTLERASSTLGTNNVGEDGLPKRLPSKRSSMLSNLLQTLGIKSKP